MKRTIVAAIFALAMATPCWAEEAAGDWTGFLNRDFKLVLHLSKDADGHYEGFLRAVDQGGAIIPLDDIAATPDTLAFHAASKQLHVNGRYSAKWDEAEKQWLGTWTMGTSSELNFKRATATALETPKRPQEEAIAAAQLPYVSEHVSFANPAAPGVILAGTFSKPKGSGPFPAVVLVSGTGPNTRDEEFYGHKTFLVLADALNRAGIAVLRYDKRGIGDSKGDYLAATTADYASDAEAAVSWLKTRSDVAQNHIGVIGHSEGGTIAPIVAVADADVSFMVSMAGVAIRGDLNGEFQDDLLARARGDSEAQIARKRSLTEQASQVVVASKSREEARAQLMVLADAAIAKGLIDKKTADSAIENMTSPHGYYSLRYDPTETLKKVKVPVLAVYGTLDLQVPPSANVPALREALKGDSDVTIVELPGLNHLFQTASRGDMEEYRDIEETISPAALKLISSWVVAHSK